MIALALILSVGIASYGAWRVVRASSASRLAWEKAHADAVVRVAEIEAESKDKDRAADIEKSKRADRPDSLVAKAIRDAAGGDPRLTAHFWQVCRRYRAENPTATEEEVAGQVGWQATDVEGTQ